MTGCYLTGLTEGSKLQQSPVREKKPAGNISPPFTFAQLTTTSSSCTRTSTTVAWLKQACNRPHKRKKPLVQVVFDRWSTASGSAIQNAMSQCQRSTIHNLIDKLTTNLPLSRELSFQSMHGWTLMWRPNLGPLRKSVKYNNIILKGGDLLACECWGLATASQKAASQTTNTKATALCEQIYRWYRTFPNYDIWELILYQVLNDLSRKGWTNFQ